MQIGGKLTIHKVIFSCAKAQIHPLFDNKAKRARGDKRVKGKPDIQVGEQLGLPSRGGRISRLSVGE